jgi:hypothetical protein
MEERKKLNSLKSFFSDEVNREDYGDLARGFLSCMPNDQGEKRIPMSFG